MQKKRLFSDEQRVVSQKPQYKMLSSVKEEAIVKLANWLVSDYKLPDYSARILSKEIVPRIIKEQQTAIRLTAPNVYLTKDSVLESVLMKARHLALDLDEKGQLEEILENNAQQEDTEKYGI